MPGSAEQFGSLGAGDLVDAGDPGWSRFVAAHPDATCFHQPAWLATLSRAYGFRALVAVQRDPAGTVVAGLPLVEVRRPTGTRRWSCLPFSDECGPLVAPGGSAAALLSRTEALGRARGVAELEVRTAVEFPGARSRQVAVTHALALASAAGTGQRLPPFRGSVRRHIATARRAGVQVRAAEVVDEVVGTYYRLLVLIARHGGTAVAGAVYLVGGRTVTYKYGASDSRAWSLRPNHAVMAEAIAWATERQYTTFDLGRTDLDNPGLVQFKESWGADTRPLCYTSSSGRVGYRAGSAAHGLLASLIRRSPAAVCRGLGELLYRYAA
jgi:CelD/BcsL family acetyltransferase involved in cellulose biosynthesis